MRLTGISGSPVIGYVEFSDWLSETELRVAEYAFICCILEVMDGFVLRYHECQPRELCLLFVRTCVFSAIECDKIVKLMFVLSLFSSTLVFLEQKISVERQFTRLNFNN